MEKAKTTSRVYSGRILNLRVDEVTSADGKQFLREVVEHRGAAAIVPLTQDGDVVMVKQFRYAIGRELLEIPAGTLEAGEMPEDCAARELEEETGYKANEIKKLMELYMVPGYSTEKIHVYLAKELIKSGTRTEEDESITLEIMPLKKALEKARAGEICDAKSICGLFRASEVL